MGKRSTAFLRRPDSRDKVEENTGRGICYLTPYFFNGLKIETAVAGTEACPASAATGQFEQHISGDIAFAGEWYHFG